MAVYQSTFEINASAEAVWDVLTRLDLYAEWNPQIPQASGAIHPGSQIDLRLALPGRPALDLSARIDDARRSELLTWRGHVLAPWFFEGRRRFEIERLAEQRVRVTHVEAVYGLFSPVFVLLMDAAVKKSQAALNEALRVRAERA